MKIDEFEDLIGRFGEDPAAWPDDLRPAAQRLVADSAAARALVDEHRRLRAGLDEAATPRPSPGLLDRILDAAFEDDPAAAAGIGRQRR